MLTLAVGVAATAVILSIVCALLVSPLPYRDIDRSVVATLRGVTDVGGLSHAVVGWLPGISATGPVMLGAVGAVVAVVGLAARLLPALRAARVDPVVALRVE